MATTTNSNTELFDRELVEHQAGERESHFTGHGGEYEPDRRYGQPLAEQIERRVAESARARRRRTARTVAAGIVIAAVAAGGTWLIADSTSANGSTQTGAALTRPSIAAVTVRPVRSHTTNGTIPSANNTGDMGTGTGNNGPSANNTGNMGTGTGNNGPSANNTGNMGTGTGNNGPSANNTGNMGTGTGNNGPSANNTGNMGTGTGNNGPSASNTGNMGTSIGTGSAS
jgi:hypothetical protein